VEEAEALPRSFSEGRIDYVGMGKTDMKSLISSHCRRHCLSLHVTLRFPILFESCLMFMNTSLNYLLGMHQRMNRGKQAGIDDDGELPFTWGTHARASFDKAETEVVDGVRQSAVLVRQYVPTIVCRNQLDNAERRDQDQMKVQITELRVTFWHTDNQILLSAAAAPER
jgi:hypothetical protein